jgi:RNA polymerase sigma-70 factor (ECF subfamily)
LVIMSTPLEHSVDKGMMRAVSTMGQAHDAGSAFGADAGLALGLPSSSARPRMSADRQERFRRMVTDNVDFIWRTLRGLGVPSAAVDDAAQQVFLVAAQRLDAIACGAERSFLFSTARGVAANMRRSLARSREDQDDFAVATHADDAANPEQALSEKEALALLDRLLQKLPEDLRTVFVLFELEGLTAAAIAELLDVPPGTVASRLRRAREEFQAATRRLQAGEGRP